MPVPAATTASAGGTTVPAAGPAAPVAQASQLSLAQLGAFAAAHVALGWVMRAEPAIATLHALACLAIGVVIAARRPLYQVAYAVAYIAGSEVLWRMTHAAVFWEYGKYAVAIVLGVAVFRVRLKRNVGMALAYFGLLVPSVLLTVLALPADLARQLISFNLSGPLSLALCVLVFSNLRLTTQQLTTTFYALIAPVIGIAAISYFSTIGSANLEFTGQSNAVTSGGFGPNQVSAMLGLGFLLTVLMLFGRLQSPRMRWPLTVLAVVLATQCALTFSRGGLVMAFASLLAAMIYLLRNSRTRVTLLMVASVLTVVARYVVVPRLDTFTQGKISERYMTAKSSNRDTLALADLEIFSDNLALGVGPGVASTIRLDSGERVAAHTEFTRMLSEHGILGAISMILLFSLGLRTARTARTLTARAFVIAMLVWFNLFLLINAMRIVAPSFLFGLACSVAYASLRAQAQARAAPSKIASQWSRTAPQSQAAASA